MGCDSEAVQARLAYMLSWLEGSVGVTSSVSATTVPTCSHPHQSLGTSAEHPPAPLLPGLRKYLFCVL